MLWTIVVVLFVLWLLGFTTDFMGDFIHVLLLIALAMIVRSFRLETAPDHRVWPVHRITLRPQGGLNMFLHRR